jgi:hypothetical protein
LILPALLLLLIGVGLGSGLVGLFKSMGEEPTSSTTSSAVGDADAPESPEPAQQALLTGTLEDGLTAGQNGDFERASSAPEISPVTSSSPSATSRRISDRYRPLGPNGAIIEDTTTGLQWMRCSQGQQWTGDTCDSDAARRAWDEAMQIAREFSFADHTDWRLPTKEELRTLVYCSSGQPKTWNDTGHSCKGDYDYPTIDQIAFPSTPHTREYGVWSSSPSANNSDDAWFVDFSEGTLGSGYKKFDFRVWLVRGGQ